MKKYLYNYIEKIDKLISDEKIINTDVVNEHLIKINFFQHERLIHLIVTLFYAFIFILFTSLGFVSNLFFIIAFIIMVFLLFYIVHYFRLENGVQYLYTQYDKMKNKTNVK